MEAPHSNPFATANNPFVEAGNPFSAKDRNPKADSNDNIQIQEAVVRTSYETIQMDRENDNSGNNPFTSQWSLNNLPTTSACITCHEIRLHSLVHPLYW